MAADTFMALTLVFAMFTALGTFWVDEKLRRRQERQCQKEIESLQRRDCS